VIGIFTGLSILFFKISLDFLKYFSTKFELLMVSATSDCIFDDVTIFGTKLISFLSEYLFKLSLVNKHSVV